MDGLKSHLEDSDPGFLARIQERKERGSPKLHETSGFPESASLYELLVPEGDRKLIRTPKEAPNYLSNDTDVEVVVHMGCHVIKTPHIIDSTLDVFEDLGFTAVPLGGFNNCCGIQHIAIGDIEGAEAVDGNRYANIAAFDPEYAITECTSCYAVTAKLSMGYRSPDFSMCSMVEFLSDHEDRLLEQIEVTDPVKIAIHDHYDARGWTPPEQPQLVRKLFSTLPGVEIVEMEHSMETGLPCNFQTDLDEWEYDDLSDQVYNEAIAVNADVLITFWHACHRHFGSYQYKYPIATRNYATFIAERLGHSYEDKSHKYQEMAQTQGIDCVIDELRPIFESNGLSQETARSIVETQLTGPESVGTC